VKVFREALPWPGASGILGFAPLSLTLYDSKSRSQIKF
jgi:hypothetical protein